MARGVLAVRDAEIERLRARVAELETPTHYWCDMDSEAVYRTIDDVIDGNDTNTDIIVGGAVGIVPIRQLPREWYGFVPGMRDDDWLCGDFVGRCELVGPFASEDEAKAEAVRITDERRLAMASAAEPAAGDAQPSRPAGRDGNQLEDTR